MALHIEAALARCAGRIEGADEAARMIEINPHPLRADAQARHRLEPLPQLALGATPWRTSARAGAFVFRILTVASASELRDR